MTLARHFDDHSGAPVQCVAHCPIDHNQGFTRRHWTSPSGNYSHRISPASPPWSSTAATQQTQQQKTFRVTVHCAYAKLVKKDTKGTLYSSHLKFEFVEITIDSEKAETIRNFSSYQTLRLDKNLWRISSPKKLKKSCDS